MGQINCQCQYIRSDDFDSFKRSNSSLQLPSRTIDPLAHLSTRILLKNGPRCLEIRLGEFLRSTFGTTQDSQQKPEHLNANSFKMEVRIRNHQAYIQDCGVGLGVFLLKRKIVKRADGGELLLNACDKWVVLKISQAQQITYSVHEGESSKCGLLQKKQEHEISLGGEALVVKREREGKNYAIRRRDRKEIWVLLGEERRVKAGDVLRLGFQFYQVESITTCIEPSKTTRMY